MLSDFLGSLGSIALAALGIGFLIFIHEAGHFLAARAAGVRVEVFSLGFGPRIWGFRKGPTDYRLSALPIGGYVLVAGADPSEPPKRKDDLVAKGFFARATFYSGGIVMNALFSMLAFAILFKVGVPLPAPVLGQITEGGAAWQAGLEEGDRILSVDGETIRDFNALRLEIALSDSENDTNIVVERAEEQFTAQLRPEYSTALGFRDLGASPALEDAPLVVQDVDEDSPAKAAGLNSGDAIIGINGTRATGFELYEAYGKAFDQPGEVSLALQLPNDNVRTITFETRALENTPKRLGVAQARDQVRALRDVEAVRALGLQVGDRLLDLHLASRPEDSGAFLGPDGIAPVLVPEDGPSESATVLCRIVREGSEQELRAELSLADREALALSVAREPSDAVCRLVPRTNSPASLAGIEPGDVLLRVGRADEDRSNWRPTPDFQVLVEIVNNAEGATLGLECARDGETFFVDAITPESARIGDPGFTIQIRELTDDVKTDSFGDAMSAGFDASVQLIKRLYLTVQRMFTGDVDSKNLSGIVGISRVAYGAAERGMAYLLYFLALISMNLAFFNILPIPLFDGGSLLFLFIEKIKGSPVDARVMGYTQLLGLAFLIFLMLYVTYNDLSRL